MLRWWNVVGALVLLASFGGEARAQMGIARGKIVDQEGAPVKGATIQLDFLGGVERQYKTETNDKGMYTQVVVAGSYRVTASKDGYQGIYLDTRVDAGSPTDLPTLKIVNRQAAAQAALAPILKEFDKAKELTQAGKLDEAIAVYLALEEEHQGIPELYYNLGMLYARQEKWPEAEQAFGKVLEIEPDNSQVQVMLAEVHKNMGQGDEAVAALEKLVQESPEDAKLRYDLGRFYLNSQRYEDAYAAFEEVRRLDPENVDVLYLLGTLSLNLGQIDQAVAHLQSYLDEAPEDGQYRATATELLKNLRPAEPQSP